MSLSYSTICERLRAHAKYTPEADFGGGRLEYPPASELEIQACEARLGFSLPPLLRELYLTVANGGAILPPTYSFNTISPNLVRRGSGNPVLGEYVGQGPRPFDDAIVEALRTHPGAYIVCERMPADFIDFAWLGCDVRAHLDGRTGHIYISDSHSTNGEIDGLVFSFGAVSFEEWLERWLAVPISRSSEGRYQPHYPLADLSDNEDKSAEDEEQTPDSPVRRFESPEDSFRKQMLSGLEKARMEITRQIYYLDAVQRDIAEGDAPNHYKQAWLPNLSLTMPQLAEVEAQLDNLIETPWLR